MSQDERFGCRDLTYSAWHRRESTRRYIGIEYAQLLAMIDCDVSLWIEYDDGTKEPVALLEVARDVGQSMKPGTVMKALARKASIPCFVVLYKLANEMNPASMEHHDIEQFRVRRLHPAPEEREWRTMTAEEYAQFLLRVRKWSADRQ